MSKKLNIENIENINKDKNKKDKKDKLNDKKTKKANILKFVLIFLATLILVISVGYAYLNNKFKEGMYEKRNKENYTITDGDGTNEDGENSNNEIANGGAINVLILGTDKEGLRTDVAMIVHYDPYSKTTSLFSVPRDYKIGLSDKAQESLNYYAPYIKFSEIFAYCQMADMESPSSYITQIIEETLDFKINHFVLVNLKSFREAVDAVGGVEVYVPERLYWSDPIQDLYIDLEEGMQLLDGEKAEQLVRFRNSADGGGYGDFGRMQIQQYFLTAYVKKLLSVGNISKINEVITPISKMITTDASLADALYLLNMAKDADFDRVSAHTLPGSDSWIGKKYFFSPPNKTELKRFFITTIIQDMQVFDQNSKEYKIDVYGVSSDKEEQAKDLVDKLIQDGYDAEYKGVHRIWNNIKTIIYVPEHSLGGDLKPYLDISEIQIDENLKEDKIIEIYLGKVQTK